MKYLLVTCIVIIGLIIVTLLIRSSLTTNYQSTIINSPSLLPAGLDAQGRATSTTKK